MSNIYNSSSEQNSILMAVLGNSGRPASAGLGIYPNNPLNTGLVTDLIKTNTKISSTQILNLFQALGLNTFNNIYVNATYSTTLQNYISNLPEKVKPALLSYLLTAYSIVIKDLLEGETTPTVNYMELPIRTNMILPTSPYTGVNMISDVVMAKPEKIKDGTEKWSIYDAQLYTALYSQIGKMDSLRQKMAINTLGDMYYYATYYVYGAGFPAGLIYRMKEMTAVREGLNGYHRSKSLNEMQYGTAKVFKLLESSFPIVPISSLKKYENYVIQNELESITGKFIKPIVAFNSDGFVEEFENYKRLFGGSEGMQIMEDLLDFVKTTATDEFPTYEVPKFPTLSYRADAKAGAPFAYNEKKGAVLLDSFRLLIEMISDLKTAKTKESKNAWVQKYKWSYCGYIFPKAEVYSNEKYFSSIRNIFSCCTPVFLATALFLQPLSDTTIINNTTAKEMNHMSLYKFNPFNGGIDRFLTNILRGIASDVLEGKRHGYLKFIYADNIYIVSYQVQSDKKLEEYENFFEDIKTPEDMINQYQSNNGYVREFFQKHWNTPDHDVNKFMKKRKGCFIDIGEILSFIEFLDIKVVYYSLDLTKGEANATPSVARTMIYYLLAYGMMDGKGRSKVDSTWLDYYLNVLPNQIVDCISIYDNVKFRTPGQGSGNPLTFQINHCMSTIYLDALEGTMYASPFISLVNLESASARTGIDCKIELSNVDFISEIKKAYTTVLDARGVLSSQGDSTEPVLSEITLDLLGWDACYSPLFSCFVPVLAKDRLMKACTFNKMMTPTTSPQTTRDDATMQRFLAAAGRYLCLYLIGGWKEPGLGVSLLNCYAEVLENMRTFRNTFTFENLDIDKLRLPVEGIGLEEVKDMMISIINSTEGVTHNEILERLMFPMRHDLAIGLSKPEFALSRRMFTTLSDIRNIQSDITRISRNNINQFRGDESLDIEAMIKSIKLLSLSILPFEGSADLRHSENLITINGKTLFEKVSGLKGTATTDKEKNEARLALKEYRQLVARVLSSVQDSLDLASKYVTENIDFNQSNLNAFESRMENMVRGRGLNVPSNPRNLRDKNVMSKHPKVDIEAIKQEVTYASKLMEGINAEYDTMTVQTQVDLTDPRIHPKIDAIGGMDTPVINNLIDSTIEREIKTPGTEMNVEYIKEVSDRDERLKVAEPVKTEVKVGGKVVELDSWAEPLPEIDEDPIFRLDEVIDPEVTLVMSDDFMDRMRRSMIRRILPTSKTSPSSSST